MNYLFTTWEGGGNVTPALEAARRLLARGHRVRVISEACNRPEAEAAGANFLSWRRAPSRSDRTRHSQTFKDWAAESPQEGLLTVIRDVWCGPALAYAQDVVEELEREPADLVVTCEALFGVMAGCQSVGQSFAILSPNISLRPLPGIPPLGPGLPPAQNEQEAAMHAGIAVAVASMFDSGLPALNEARASLGLEALEHLVDQFDEASIELLATSPAFDFPTDSLPPKVRYVGPILADPLWTESWESPWPASDQRPLALVAFSTTFQNHTELMQTLVDALSELPVRVLVTLGGPLESGDIRAASNCHIVESAPHSQVMKEASLIITHGGHGTVIKGLASQTPMLLLPHGRDQNDNAVRVVARGAGLSLEKNAAKNAIQAACRRLLEEPEFLAAAQQLGALVAEHAAQSSVVEELEEAARQAGNREARAIGHC